MGKRKGRRWIILLCLLAAAGLVFWLTFGRTEERDPAGTLVRIFPQQAGWMRAAQRGA